MRLILFWAHTASTYLSGVPSRGQCPRHGNLVWPCLGRQATAPAVLTLIIQTFPFSVPESLLFSLYVVVSLDDVLIDWVQRVVIEEAFTGRKSWRELFGGVLLDDHRVQPP